MALLHEMKQAGVGCSQGIIFTLPNPFPMKHRIRLLLFLFCLCSGRAVAQAWQPLANVPEDLAFPVVVALRGNIHVIGGGAPQGATDLHLRYTPATDTWDTLAPLPYLAQQPAGAVVDEKIHVCGGGYPTTGQRLDKHYFYDPDSMQWYPAASLPVAIAIHKAVSFDGKLWCLSGQPDKSLCEYYDPVTDQWYQKNALPDQNFWYGALVATGSTIYRFGGGAYFAPTASAHRYDPANDVWIALPPIPQPLHALAGVALNDSTICVTGGFGLSAETAQAWVYRTGSQTYTFIDSLPVARDYHSMVRIDSCVYSVGGYHVNIAGLPYSLIRNCNPSSPLGTGGPASPKPYAVTATNSSFRLDLGETHRRADVFLTDVSGKTVFAGTANGSLTVRADRWKTGLYLVRIVTEGRVYPEKWMVVR